MPSAIEARLRKAERRFADRLCGVHRYTDDELTGLIAWLKDPHPEGEEQAVALLRREGMIP